jgi:hypothetical protein
LHEHARGLQPPNLACGSSDEASIDESGARARGDVVDGRVKPRKEREEGREEGGRREWGRLCGTDAVGRCPHPTNGGDDRRAPSMRRYRGRRWSPLSHLLDDVRASAPAEFNRFDVCPLYPLLSNHFGKPIIPTPCEAAIMLVVGREAASMSAVRGC